MPSSCLKRAQRFFRPSQLSAAIAGVFFVASPLAWAQPAFISLPGISADGISGDGRVVTGEMAGGYAGQSVAFRWTAERGAVSLGMLDAGIPGFYGFSNGRSLNYDGTVIVGSSTVILNGLPNGTRAFRWTAAGGMQSLGLMGGAGSSWSNGVSNDGNVVVGASDTVIPGLPNSKIEAFRWTAQSGMVGLGGLPGSQALFSEANAVSGDGLVIVGESSGANGTEAFRWTQAGGMAGLGDLPGGVFSSRALATNLDGSVVVGHSQSANGIEAFRWTQGGGMTGLGDLPGGAFESAAYALSTDGKIVVGAGTTDRGREAFRWTQAGMRSLVDWLSDNGVKVAPGYLLKTAHGLSADGSVILGSMLNGTIEESFIARVSSVGSGVITASAVQQTLGSAQTSSEMALRSGATILNGAHSRPLTRRVPEGQKAFWMAGDWGQDDHGARNGDLGLAEVGGGLHLGTTQLNVALGHTWAKQVQRLNSRAEINGDYLHADLLIPVTGSLWGVLGAFHHWGAADLRRGYLNAGMPDTSRGNSDAKSWGVRARLEWENALALSSASFSPYVDLSYGESKMAAYTETGGGFPARFDARTEKSTELRLGLNGAYPVAGNARLVGLVEASHRFEKNSARTSGELLGLFGFDLAGVELDRDWLRAGLGLEGKIGGGSASLMLNATTKGETPSVWLAASWQMAF